MPDADSLGPRARHVLETGEGDQAALGEYLQTASELLRTLDDRLWAVMGEEVADQLFELRLVLYTLEQALAGDGETGLQLWLKRRPYTSKGGRRPNSVELEWRYQAAARLARGFMPELRKPAAIERALAEMRAAGRASGLTPNGLAARMTSRRKSGARVHRRNRVSTI